MNGRENIPPRKNLATGVAFFDFFTYFCRRENSLYHNRVNRIRVGYHRHLPAATAHHAVAAFGGGSLFPFVATIVRLAAQPPLFWQLYPQFPGEPRYTSARKDRIGQSAVANNGLLHCGSYRAAMVAYRIRRSGGGYHHSYSLVQNPTQIIKKAENPQDPPLNLFSIRLIEAGDNPVPLPDHP